MRRKTISAALVAGLGAAVLAGCGSGGSASAPATTLVQSGARCSLRGGLPDAACTPGAVDAAVTEANVDQTVCRPGGYTRSVRPSVAVTSRIKRQQMAAYGMSGVPTADVELDHLVPLSIGGSSDVANLWPEPLHLAVGSEDLGAKVKDQLELYERELLCSHRTTLAAAQRAFTSDWVAAWKAAGQPRTTYRGSAD